MPKIPLIIKDLSIGKIPGFPEGLKAYKNFAANINIISGPNASGKSSTARIIKQIIWTKNTDGVKADSSVEIENENWDVKIDSKSISIQREGIEDEFQGLPAYESNNRYDLALHDLVKDEDEDIELDEEGEPIVKESVKKTSKVVKPKKITSCFVLNLV